MDPASIVQLAINEIALDGVFGMQKAYLWRYLDSVLPQPLDDALKQAIWTCITADPRIRVEENSQSEETSLAKPKTQPDSSHSKFQDTSDPENDLRLFASIELQWQTLTGAPQLDNLVGEKAFEVLCLIAHRREEGCSTVRICKETGQDARLLFSRTQTLEKAGLIRRFPVIEGGAATNLWLLQKFARSSVTNSSSPNVIDKTALYEEIISYCKSGPQNLRLVRSITHHIGQVLPDLKKHRLRPTVMNALKELEGLNCLKRLMVMSSALPEHSYQAVEFVRDLSNKFKNSSSAPGVVPWGGSISSITFEDDEEDVEDEDSRIELPVSPELDDLKVELSGPISTVSFRESLASRVKATVVFPLVNQIFDAIRESGNQGISAMDLNRTLTGPKFGKILPIYLSCLTSQNSKNSVQPPQLNHLSLIKGVDFNRRVKFYRYFTKLHFPQANYDNNEKQLWGSFDPASKETAIPKSLLEIEIDYIQPLRLNCVLFRTDDGKVKPIFHGEMNNLTNGDIILKSENGKQSSSVGLGKKRGRPPKIQTKKARFDPDISKQEVPKPDEVEMFKSEAVKVVVPMRLRKWKGGKPAKDHRISTYLSMIGPNNHTLNSVSTLSVKSESIKSNSGSNSGSNSIGSVAMRQRIDTFMKMLRDHGGVIQGGSHLRAKFDKLTSGESSIDRRTMMNLINRLMGSGLIKQIAMNVPTSSKVVLKYIYYDPKTILDPSTDSRILRIKSDLLEGNLDSHSLSVRTASSTSRNFELPVKEMTADQINSLQPLPQTGRIMTTRSVNRIASKPKTRYGPSASETLGIDNDGKSKRASKRAKNYISSTIDKATEGKVTNDKPSKRDEKDTQKNLANPVQVDPRLTVLDPMSEISRVANQTHTDIDWLARSVIVFKSLNPRRGSSIDWSIVAAGIPNITASNAQKLWPECRKHLSEANKHIRSVDIVPELIDQFENLFMNAFHSGKILDPRGEKLEKLIPKLVKFWLNAEQDCAEKSSSRKFTESELIINRLENLQLMPKLQEHVDQFANLQAQASMINAERILADSPFSVRLDIFELSDHKFTDAEMRLRAVIAADSGEVFKPELASLELADLSTEDLQLARSGLEQKRFIKWGESDLAKTPTGRPFVLDDSITQCLAIPKLDVSVLKSAAFKMNALIGSKALIDIPATIEDADVVSLVDLATCGFRNKLAKINRVDEKFGLISSDYKSRDIDKQKFECKLCCQIIEKQPFDDEDEILDDIGMNDDFSDDIQTDEIPHFVTPPVTPNWNRPWIWQTKNLQSDQIWRKIVYRVFSLVLFRPGITFNTIAVTLKAALEIEETKSVIDAMVSKGILHQCSTSEGLSVSPEWYKYLV